MYTNRRFALGDEEQSSVDRLNDITVAHDALSLYTVAFAH